MPGADVTTGTWTMIADARVDLANYLGALPDDDWNAPSLCSEWKVRDVVAHLVQATRPISMTTMLLHVAHSGFNLNKAIERSAKNEAKQSPEQLLNALRDGTDSRSAPRTAGPRSLLADLVVHTQDIRRPLGALGSIPEVRLRAALDHMPRIQAVLSNTQRIAGLRLRATDMDWSYGSGVVVAGTGEALLMAMCGRKCVLDELIGPGVETLRVR